MASPLHGRAVAAGRSKGQVRVTDPAKGPDLVHEVSLGRDARDRPARARLARIRARHRAAGRRDPRARRALRHHRGRRAGAPAPGDEAARAAAADDDRATRPRPTGRGRAGRQGGVRGCRPAPACARPGLRLLMPSVSEQNFEFGCIVQPVGAGRSSRPGAVAPRETSRPAARYESTASAPRTAKAEPVPQRPRAPRPPA
jgi:hypothetical protein